MEKPYYQKFEEERAKHQMICVKCYHVYTPPTCGWKYNKKLKRDLMCCPICKAHSYW